jgi:hypothetical protein
MSIARTPDRKGTRRCRASRPITNEQTSVVIDGRSIVEAYTNPRLPRDFSNSPPTSQGSTQKLHRQIEQLELRLEEQESNRSEHAKPGTSSRSIDQNG